MSRVTHLLGTRGNRKLLVPFFTAGYPTINGSYSLISKAANAGADIIEIGMPFSDPLADGPSIQYSSQIALEQGTNLDTVFDLVKKVRRTTETPILLMGYFNPILAFGPSRFVSKCAAVGVDGLIIPDLPLDEAGEIRTLLVKKQLSLILLAAPTSTDQRLKQINRLATDFVYAVTVTGVTGSRTSFDRSTDDYLRRLSRILDKPFVAGFGVSSAESARRLARHADGVVLGSALIEIVRKQGSTGGEAQVVKLLSQIRRELDRNQG
ncbi:MAG: tryptophan synthase subunit alpha [Candidatus Zixiibacteriota bacterium]